MDDSSKIQREEWLAKADILTEALPYMREYAGQTIVVKYGGHAMGDAELSRAFARDVSDRGAAIETRRAVESLSCSASRLTISSRMVLDFSQSLSKVTITGISCQI